MLRNYLAAVFGNLFRDWFYAWIIILGLAVGFAAAMLIGLYVYDEYSFERFIPGYRHVYRLEMDILAPGAEPQRTDMSWNTVAASVALDFPEVEHVARLALSSQWVGEGEAKSRERVAWVDPEFFGVLPFPVLAGDPVAALHEPDSVVLTHAMARKYFGQDAPIGKTLLVQSVQGDPTAHPMVVRAVLKDLPGETHLEQFKIFASGLAGWSYLTAFDQSSGVSLVWTYVRLRPGVPVDPVLAGLPSFAKRHYPRTIAARFRLEPIKDLHFTDDARAVDAGIAAVGALIIVVAGINFVALMTARGTRRAVEVAVRKVLGARRRHLIIRFMGEALIYVLLAAVISLAIVELALPPVNVFLRRTIAFDLMDDSALATTIAGTALLTGLFAGLYPAVILSGFRPSSALKAGSGLLMGTAQIRKALVVAQFTILIGLIILAATIWRQTAFLLQNVHRLNEDRVLYIVAPCEYQRAFQQELAAIPGVSAVTCASDQATSTFPLKTRVKDPAKGTISIDAAPIGVGFFEMHGLKPLAGRFFSKDQGQDVVLDRADRDPGAQPTVVLNESGVRQLGFESPDAAVGKRLVWSRLSAEPPGTAPPFRGSQIIGVVPDFTLGTLRDTIEPTMYYVDPPSTGLILAELEESRLPETLRSIDALWRRTGHVRPIYREFFGEIMRQTYRDVIVQGRIIAAGTGLAILIACLGLFALAVFTTGRRTKEIGVRKAMGASSSDVVRLLLWQFTRPVVFASLIAWPAAYWAAGRWLQGFAYRVSLPPWLFLSASAAAVLIALATVGAHAWLAANAKPAIALRYE